MLDRNSILNPTVLFFRIFSIRRIGVLSFGIFIVVLCLSSAANIEGSEEKKEVLFVYKPKSTVSLKFIESFGFIETFEPLRKSSQSNVRLSRGGQGAPKRSKTSRFVGKIYRAKLQPGQSASVAAKSLERHPDIAIAEPVIPLTIFNSVPPEFQDVLPNDVQFSKLWHLFNDGQGSESREGEDIDILNAWKTYKGDPDFLMAIIDTGADFFHPDLVDNLWVNSGEIPGNGIDDDSNGYIDDIHGYDFQNDDSDPYDDSGHGTHVSGIAGAVGNNGQGIVGINWKIDLMQLKAFNNKGRGNTSTGIAAIEYAVENGAKIINASWGAEDKSRLLKQVIEKAREDGVLTIAAAGNDSKQIKNYPAAFESVISVASVDSGGRKSEFTNHGPTIDISAPGTAIFSTKVNNSYGSLNGTSMATPIVSGVAALVWGKNPDFSLVDVENILLSGVDVIDVKEELGAGRINANKALEFQEPIPTVSLVMPEKVGGQFDIIGTASGDTFKEFTLEIGKGNSPKDWTFIHSSQIPVLSSTLYNGFSTADYQDGQYTFRLRAKNSQGKESTTQKRVEIENVDIIYPDNNDFLSTRNPIEIRGSVFGLNRTYKLEYGEGISPAQWSDSGIEIPDHIPGNIQNDVLGIWNVQNLPGEKFYTLRLTATSLDNEELIDQEYSWLIYFDDRISSGWPVSVDLPTNDLKSIDWTSFKIADFDNDGFQEIALVKPGDGEFIPAEVMVLSHQGNLLWSKKLGIGRPSTGSLVIGNLNQDPNLEIVVDGGANGKVYAFNSSGQLLQGDWPVDLPGSRMGISIVDLDTDGVNEIVTFNNEAFFLGNTPRRQLSILDPHGRVLKLWRVDDCFHENDVVEIVPSYGDLDRDGKLEIVIPSSCGELSMFHIDKSSEPEWTSDVKGQILTSPVIGDLDGNATLEVIVSTYDERSLNRGGVYAFGGDGRVFGDFPVLVEYSFLDAPVLADFDNDSDLEIVINDRIAGQIHLIHHDGFPADGWPSEPLINENFRGQVSIGDIDGDSELEILSTVHGIFYLFANSLDAEKLGGIRSYEFDGTRTMWENQFNPKNMIPIPSPGVSIADKNHLIQFTDLDSDGFLDVLLSTAIDMSYVPNQPSSIKSKNTFSIFAWELGVNYRSDLFPWSSYHVNASQWGRFDIPPKPNLPPEIKRIPTQIASISELWVPYPLKPYISDPDHSMNELNINISADPVLDWELTDDWVLFVSTNDPAWQGTAEVQVTVTDPRFDTNTQIIRFIANDQLTFPVANPDFITLSEDQSIVVDALSNDSDPSGEKPKLISTGTTESGFLEINEDQKILFTPNADVNGEVKVQYFIRGSSGGQSVGLITFRILPQNDPPTTVDDKFLIDEDNKITVDILLNDFDVDGDEIKVAGYGAPKNGSFVPTENGTFEYTPNQNYFGQDQLDYTIRDSSGLVSSGQIMFIIRPVNDPPVADDLSITVNKNSFETVIFSATDVDGDELEFEVNQNPKEGDVLVFPTLAEYSPNENYVGEDDFQYIAKDEFSESLPASVKILVLDKNNPPKAQSDRYTTLVDQSIDIEFKANDPDGDAYSIVIGESPENGQLSETDDEFIYKYTPDPGFIGDDEISFFAKDMEDAGSTARIKIEVTGENSSPTAKDQFVSTRQNIPLEFDLSAIDGEGTVLQIRLQEAPVNGDVHFEGVRAIYTPRKDFLGLDKFSYSAFDGEFESLVATVFITVKVPNEAPEIFDKKIILTKGKRFSFQLPVSDPDGDSLRSAIVVGPENGFIYGLGTNYTYKPDSFYSGSDSLTFRSWDGATYGSIGRVEFEIVSNPDPIPLKIRQFHVSPGGEYSLEISATHGLSLTLEYSYDLKNWSFASEKEVLSNTLLFKGGIPQNPTPGNSIFFRVLSNERISF